MAEFPAPTKHEKLQVYVQRYVEDLPAGGEITIFGRSWYVAPSDDRKRTRLDIIRHLLRHIPY